MVDKIVYFLIHQAKGLLIATFFLAIIMIVFSQAPKIDGRLAGFNAIESEQYQQGEAIAKKFGSETVIQILIEPELTKSAKVFLTSLKELQTELEELFPNSKIQSLYQGKKLLNVSKKRNPSVAVLLNKASKIPGLNQLVSYDSSKCMMVLFLDEVDNFDVVVFDEVLNKKFKSIRGFNVMSSFHIEKGVADALSKDLIVISSIILFFFVTIIVLIYKSFKALIFCLILITLGLIPSFFFFTLFDIPINLITVLVLPVVLILCVADAIHLLTGFSTSDLELSSEEKIALTLKKYVIPSFITSATTAVAFFSFLLNDSSNIQEFGMITGCTVMFAFFFTYGAAPFIMRMLKTRESSAYLITKISWGLERMKGAVSIGLLALFILAIYFIPRLKFDTDFQIFFPKNSKVLADHDKIDEAFNSQVSIDLMLTSNTLKPEELQGRVFTLHDQISAIPEVSSVNSYKDEAEFIQGFGVAASFIKLTMKNNSFKTADGLSQRMIVKLNAANDLDSVVRAINFIISNYQERSIEVKMFSKGLLFKDVNKQVAASLFRSLMFSFVFIGLIMLAMTRSLKATLIGLFVNVIPLSFIALLIYFFNYELNIVTALTAIVCMGIIVDDTIHILYRKLILKEDLKELRLGIITTSLVLFAGFSVLLLSSFVPSQTFGIICALVFLFTMITDLTLLPLILGDKEKKE